MNPTWSVSRSSFFSAEAGTRAAAPFPAPLSPPAAWFLRYAPDKFLLTKPNTFEHNREASVATLRWCSGSSRNAVRLPFGKSVQLDRNPQIAARKARLLYGVLKNRSGDKRLVLNELRGSTLGGRARAILRKGHERC